MIMMLLLPIGLTGIHAQNIGRVEGLKSFGPTNPSHGYPFYFEDKSDFRLKLCDTFTHCFLELPQPGLPIQFPFDPTDVANNNFPDESFFFAAGAGMTSSDDSARRALYGTALEGAFFAEQIIDGDQIVFARVRIRIDDLELGKTYKVTHPYGVHEFVAEADAGPGTHRGPGLSLVRDIGITAPGEFAGALDGDVGPFLRAVTTLGGSTLRPDFIANGRRYISNTTDQEFITGGFTHPDTGEVANFFRLEGPNVATRYPGGLGDVNNNCPAALKAAQATTNAANPLDPPLQCIQTNLFSLQGMIAENFGATITRATYSKTAEGVFVNVWASSIPRQRLAASVDGLGYIFMTEGTDGDGSYFIRTKLATVPGVAPADAAIPLVVTVLNIDDFDPSPKTSPIVDHLTLTANHLVGSSFTPGGLTVTVTSSNVYDPLAPSVSIFTGFNDPDLPTVGFALTDDPLADDGFATGTLLVSPATGMEAPFLTVKVESTLGGSAETKIAIEGDTAGSNLGLIANAGPDRSGETGGIVLNLKGGNSFGPTNMDYLWTHDAHGALEGLITIINPTEAAASFTTPTGLEPNFPIIGKLEVNFTLTVSDPLDPAGAKSDVTKATIEHPVALPPDDCTIVEALYKPAKGRWVIVGDCDFSYLQLIEVFLGDASGPGPIKIGETHVPPVIPVVWEVVPGNDAIPVGHPAAGSDALENRLFSHVWAVSERGSQFPFVYEVK